MKQKILFAVIMGLITTAIISFTLISFNRGLAPGFIAIWLKSWILAYSIATPVIILLAPRVQSLVTYLCKQKQV